jgi:hypothetical protein
MKKNRVRLYTALASLTGFLLTAGAGWSSR